MLVYVSVASTKTELELSNNIKVLLHKAVKHHLYDKLQKIMQRTPDSCQLCECTLICVMCSQHIAA